MLHSLFTKTWRVTAVLLVAVAIVCPVFFVFVDLQTAKVVNAYLPITAKRFTEHITGAGDWLLWLFAVVALVSRFVFKNKLVCRKFLFPLVASAVAGIITTLLKTFVGRFRPKDFFENGNYGLEPFHNAASWPSGHSAGIMASMAAIAILFPKWRVPCFIVAALIGSTRIALSAHYPGDVFAGLVLGYLCAHWIYYLLLRYKQLPEQKTEPEHSTDS